MKQKSQYNKIQEAFSCTSIEKRGITVVCIAIILITLLFRYGRFLLFDVEQPVGDEEVYSLSSEHVKKSATPLRDRIFPKLDDLVLEGERPTPLRDRIFPRTTDSTSSTKSLK